MAKDNTKYAPSIIDSKRGDFIKLHCNKKGCKEWTKALVIDEHTGWIKIVATGENGDLRNQLYFCPTHIKKK